MLLDLDGTLAPIRDRPEEVTLPPDARGAIEALRERACLVGLVSGRALADLERIAAIEGVAYAGNHGLEIRHRGGASQVASIVRPHLPAVAAFRAHFEARELAREGVWLEDKGVTLTFHYRTAPDPVAAAAFLASRVAAAAESAGLRPTLGRMVMEVRPPIEIDKGTAVRELLQGSGCRLALYAGDDLTDVDAWRALRELCDEGVLQDAVAVGVVSDETPEAVRDSADLTVDGTGEMATLLAWLAAAPPHSDPMPSEGTPS